MIGCFRLGPAPGRSARSLLYLRMSRTGGEGEVLRPAEAGAQVLHDALHANSTGRVAPEDDPSGSTCNCVATLLICCDH